MYVEDERDFPKVDPNSGEVWDPDYEIMDDGNGIIGAKYANVMDLPTRKTKKVRKIIKCIQCGGGDKDCPLCKGEEISAPYGTNLGISPYL